MDFSSHLQALLILCRGNPRLLFKDFRKIIADKKETRKEPAAPSVFSYGLTACLAIAVLTVGVNFYRSYQNVKQNEKESATVSSVIVEEITPSPVVGTSNNEAIRQHKQYRTDTIQNDAGKNKKNNEENDEENNQSTSEKENSEKEICLKDNFSSEIVLPNQLGKQYLEFTLERIEKYINWNFLLHNMKVKNTPLEEQTLGDAKHIFDKMKENNIKIRCSFGIFPCVKNSDTLTINDGDKSWSISFTRGKIKNKDIGISDFFNKKDFIGAFVISVTSSLFLQDNYMSIMENILLTRIAEAASEFLESYLKEKNIWIPNIRPAIGYPSIPDHSIKKTIFEIVDGEKTGASLTSNYAMLPLSTVCGIYISNPKSFYFSL